MRLIILFTLQISIMAAQAQTHQHSNKHFSYTLQTSATPNQIWSIWTDVSNWHLWDTALKEASLDDPIGMQANGSLISLEGRKSKFSIVEYEIGKSYTFKTKLPLGGLYVKRFLEEKNGTTYFTHEVWFKGITAGIFANVLGKNFRTVLPEVMYNVKQIAENK